MFDHVMVDLETLDSRETAVILSIGAVRFSLDPPELATPEFLGLVDAEDCQRYGLTIGADTVRWWMGQSEEARQNLYIAKVPHGDCWLAPAPLLMNLFTFNKFVLEVPDTKVWGNGATFDNMILRNAFRACEIKPAWSYRNDLCYRTMRRMFPTNVPLIEKDPAQPNGVQHNALDDARRQAKWLCHIWKQIHESPASKLIPNWNETKVNFVPTTSHIRCSRFEKGAQCIQLGYHEICVFNVEDQS